MDPITPAAAAFTSDSFLEWGVAQIALEGEKVCGDRHLASPFRDGFLVAVIDGLGHGTEAAAAAQLAGATLEAHASEPAIRLLARCHEALRSTRGAALSVASFNTAFGTVTWLGVGNVEGVILRADKQAAPPQENVMLFPGVAGHQLPSLRAVVTPINPGDLLIFFTDGIRRDFLSEPPIPGHSPQRIADRICAKYSKGTDDALVLVARYVGGPR
jgi:negative regulator of sigma-B (phosphoserine phosphatase)